MTKPTSSKEKHLPPKKDGINLLSDTGKAFRQAKFENKIRKIAFLTIGLSLLFTIGIFGLEYIQIHNFNKLQREKQDLEVQLSIYEPLIEVTQHYGARLSQIRKIFAQDNQQNAHSVYNQIVEISSSNSAVLNSAVYQSTKITGTYSLPNLALVNNLVKTIESLETKGFWKQVNITQLERKAFGDYRIEFSATL